MVWFTVLSSCHGVQGATMQKVYSEYVRIFSTDTGGSGILIPLVIELCRIDVDMSKKFRNPPGSETLLQ